MPDVSSLPMGHAFLDEMGEIRFAMQARLSRILQGREVERIGDTRFHNLKSAHPRRLHPRESVLSIHRLPDRECRTAARRGAVAWQSKTITFTVTGTGSHTH